MVWTIFNNNNSFHWDCWKLEFRCSSFPKGKVLLAFKEADSKDGTWLHLHGFCKVIILKVNIESSCMLTANLLSSNVRIYYGVYDSKEARTRCKVETLLPHYFSFSFSPVPSCSFLLFFTSLIILPLPFHTKEFYFLCIIHLSSSFSTILPSIIHDVHWFMVRKWSALLWVVHSPKRAVLNC